MRKIAFQSVSDNGQEITFKYNAAGERVLKRGPQGETAYVNQFFVIRNGAVASKHVYAGSSRVVSKLVMQEKTSVQSTSAVAPSLTAMPQGNGLKAMAGSSSRALGVREKPADPGSHGNAGNWMRRWACIISGRGILMRGRVWIRF